MNGFVCVKKPKDITSFIAAAKVRRIFGVKKTGHTGTLDPMATGVLLVAVGSATRFIELLPSHDKAYRATFLLGTTTDTLDITGNVLSQKEVVSTVSQVEEALKKFSGEIKQLPPMYSAIRKNGVRLYELARQGIEIEREEREVRIDSIKLLSSNERVNEYEIEVYCSSGTYIRSLISDIGDELKTGAVMTSLCRIMANGVSIDECYTFEQLESLSENGELHKALLPIEKLLGYPVVTVSEAQARRFSNGGELDLIRVRGLSGDGLYNVISPNGDFLGVGFADKTAGCLKARKIMSKNQ